MNQLLFYDGRRPAQYVWTRDQDTARYLADALKKSKWKVVWMVHSTHMVRPMTGYEDAFKEWQREIPF